MSVKGKVFLENPEQTTLAGFSGTSVGFQGSTECTEIILFSNPRIIIHDHDGQNCCVLCQQEGGCSMASILSAAFSVPVTAHFGFLEHFERWTELFGGEEVLCSGLEASYWPLGILE